MQKDNTVDLNRILIKRKDMQVGWGSGEGSKRSQRGEYDKNSLAMSMKISRNK